MLDKMTHICTIFFLCLQAIWGVEGALTDFCRTGGLLPDSMTCYTPYNTEKSQTQASDFCKARSELLAMFIRQKDLDLMVERLRSSYSGSYYIGLSDKRTEGTFVWDNGDRLNYNVWKSGEPNDDNTEDCVVSDISSGGKFVDVQCWVTRPYICEKNSVYDGRCDGPDPAFKWFGPKNQEVCRCRNNVQCSENGLCPENACKNGWMGRTCQHTDVAYLVSRTLQDDDITTCVNGTQLSGFMVSLNVKVMFTWMIIEGVGLTEAIIDDEGHVFDVLDNVVMVFQTEMGEVTENEQLERIYVSDSELHVLGELDSRITGVKFLVDGSDDNNRFAICSVKVSGGQNIALKQTVSMTEAFARGKVDGEAKNAIDQDYRDNSICNSMALTPYGQSSSFFELSFDEPMQMDRVKLWRPKEFGYCRLHEFTFITTNSSSMTDSQQLEMSDDSITLKTWYSENIRDNVTKIRIAMNSKGQDCNSAYIAILELEVFGDSMPCPEGTWGLFCENTCSTNCSTPNCAMHTGHCLGGCTEWSYGPFCEDSCPEGCNNGSCHMALGHCLYDCKAGFFGISCDEICPLGCKDMYCHKMNSDCFACKDGLWGHNCTQQCHPDCEDGRCNFETGLCEHEDNTLLLLLLAILIATILLALALYYLISKRRSETEPEGDAAASATPTENASKKEEEHAENQQEGEEGQEGKEGEKGQEGQEEEKGEEGEDKEEEQEKEEAEEKNASDEEDGDNVD